MIVEEIFENKKGKFIKRYSDKNVYIARDGVEYVEAVDPYELKDERIYEETEHEIEENE